MITFLRRDAVRFIKFGKGKGKNAKWRRPTGRDNKMREKRKGYPAVVSIGYGTDKKVRGLVEEKTPVEIFNLQDLAKLTEKEIGIIGKVGQKKRIDIVTKAKEMKIKLKNINTDSFLKKSVKKDKKE